MIIPEIVIISGSEGVGKSTTCERIEQYARVKQIEISGIRSAIEISNNEKIAINSIDLRGGTKVKLAYYLQRWDIKRPERKWKFNELAFIWGNKVLVNSIPTGLLMIDEIGYQEIENEKGWNSCFPVLKSGQFDLAIIVIRKTLINSAKIIWPNAEIMDIKEDGPTENAFNSIKDKIDLIFGIRDTK